MTRPTVTCMCTAVNINLLSSSFCCIVSRMKNKILHLIEEYKEIISDLGRYSDQAEMEEAWAVSIQELTPSDQGHLMTCTERPAGPETSIHESSRQYNRVSHIRWLSHSQLPYCTDANLQDSNTAVHMGFLWILTLCLPLTWSHYFDRDYVYYRPWVHWHMVSHSGNGLLRLSGQLAVRMSVLVVWLVIVMMRGSCDNHTHNSAKSPSPTYMYM